MIEITYDEKKPLLRPVVVVLVQNGLRLRFDGPGQHLRIIEVIDFSKARLTYKNDDVMRTPKGVKGAPVRVEYGPSFTRIYKDLFGPTFPGEYIPPRRIEKKGTYVLSYPGLAFTFLIPSTAWSPAANFVSVLSSSTNTTGAHSLAIFDGPTWKDVRKAYMRVSRPMPKPANAKGSGWMAHPITVESVNITGLDSIQVLRKALHPFTILLGQTNPQDVVAMLGPPDKIYRKYDRKLSIHKHRTISRPEQPYLHPRRNLPSDADYSSAITDDSGSGDDDMEIASSGKPWSESFYVSTALRQHRFAD